MTMAKPVRRYQDAPETAVAERLRARRKALGGTLKINLKFPGDVP